MLPFEHLYENLLWLDICFGISKFRTARSAGGSTLFQTAPLLSCTTTLRRSPTEAACSCVWWTRGLVVKQDQLEGTKFEQLPFRDSTGGFLWTCLNCRLVYDKRKVMVCFLCKRNVKEQKKLDS